MCLTALYASRGGPRGFVPGRGCLRGSMRRREWLRVRGFTLSSRIFHGVTVGKRHGVSPQKVLVHTPEIRLDRRRCLRPAGCRIWLQGWWGRGMRRAGGWRLAGDPTADGSRGIPLPLAPRLTGNRKGIRTTPDPFGTAYWPQDCRFSSVGGGADPGRAVRHQSAHRCQARERTGVRHRNSRRPPRYG